MSSITRDGMTLFHAANQWASRPADERFDSLEAMHAATKAYADTAVEANVRWNQLTAEPQDGGTLAIVGPSGQIATPTHFAFGQLAQRAGAPAAYLRSLPAELAAENLNHGLRTRPDDAAANLLLHQNGSLLLRAATSEKYARIWNHEVIARLMDASARFNLIPARQTFTWDGSELPEERDAALYASDHDMFAFLMSAERAIVDPTGAQLLRGIIVRNSEVGDAMLTVMGFWFRELCANHIIWGAREIAEIKLVHLGDIRGRWQEATVKIRQYMDGAASLEEAKLRELTVQIAGSKDEVLDTLFAKKSLGLTRKALAASYDAVIPSEDGDPRTVWGFAQGITRHSQETVYADERNALDRAAGKLLTINF